MRKAKLVAITSYLPTKFLSNEQLIEELEGDVSWTAQDIEDKTGIARRHIADDNECASDLGIKAAKKIFEESQYTPNDVDFLIFCTQSPDYSLPTTACLVHRELNLKKSCGAVDINQGCSGYIYGLALAKGLIESGSATNVLLITAETYSKYIHKRDRSTRTIFGDAAAATLIGAVEAKEDWIGPFVFGTDGGGENNLIVKAGGMRLPRNENTSEEITDGTGTRSLEHLFMNGPEIFNFTLKAVPESYNQLLDLAEKNEDDIDLFVFHQANKFMLDKLRSKLKIKDEKFWIDLRETGNTVSATIPLSIEKAMRSGKLSSGDLVMTLGFGVGYSWGGTLLRI